MSLDALRSGRQVGARLPDLIGSLLSFIAIASLALGLVRAPYWGWTGARTLISFAVSAVALPAFVWRSARHPVPVLDLNLLRSRVLSSASASSLLYFASFGILLLSSVLWIQGHWHYSAIKTGLSIAPGPCLVPFFATLSERLAKRIRVGVTAAFGCVVSVIGASLLLSSMGQSPAYVADFLPGWLLVCIGFALAMPTVLAAGTAELPNEQSATGSAVVNMAVQVGLVPGIAFSSRCSGLPRRAPACISLGRRGGSQSAPSWSQASRRCWSHHADDCHPSPRPARNDTHIH